MDPKACLNKWNKLATVIKDYESNKKSIYHGSGFNIPTEMYNIYNETIDYFWDMDQEIFNTYSRKTIEQKIKTLINDYRNFEELKLDDIKKIINDLKKNPISTYEVFYQIYGVGSKKASIMNLGPYNIYHKYIHKDIIFEKYRNQSYVIEVYYDNDEKDEKDVYLISVKVEARESSRADEKAQTKLKHFENVMRLLLASADNSYDVGIFDFYEEKRTYSLMLSDNNANLRQHLSGAHFRVDLTEIEQKIKENKTEKIWELLSRTKHNDIEKRLITAIGWGGKALRDEDLNRALVQFVIGLESLLQVQQKNVLVSPSIAQQIAERAAFIISNKQSGRIEIEKMVKNVYDARSKIVHGTDHNTNMRAYREALYLLRTVILRLLNEDFRDVQTIDQIQEWVKLKKYE
ncbi:HEPN domain-containing protein [Viridibacillus sp. FSL H8-0123]|uniref:HEPN domain-containing protein n=1 Tax=Viridibacillus sp. FSL H8-0123 TaxID=1928922 RepID=UPI00096D7242|nr:HEPN domain-containing protein [Viridibacillus sp. FSL H8-0123]OMC80917.1 hypothetical protein BK130_16475 [Viridibacillus sp. FSL H8-0123]